MPMPRFLDGTVPSANSFNQLAQAIDDQGIACVVRRSTSLPGIPANTDSIVSWQVEDLDNGPSGMWDPASPTFMTVRVAGTWSVTLQERWNFATTGSPYNTGQRAGKILVNGTSVFSAARASDKKAWSVDGEGVTLSMTHPALQLYPGDRIYANYWHSASGAITGLNVDYGGTYMAAVRQSNIN